MRKINKINVLSCVLAFATTLVVSIFAFKRTLTYSSISHNEGWNAFNLWAVKSGVKLYAEAPGLLAINYPPLSYWIQSVFLSEKSSALWLGRFFSWAGFIFTSGLIFFFIRKEKKDFYHAAIGAFLFCTLLNLTAPTYLGMNDPQILMQCFTFSAAIFAYFGFAVVAGILFSFGVFGKLNLLGIFLGCLCVFLIRKDYRSFFKLWFTFAISLCLLFALAWYREGSFIIQHLTVPRKYGPGEAFKLTSFYLATAQTLVLLFLYWLASLRKNAPLVERFFAILFISSLFVGAYFSGGSGVNFNIFFESLFCLCVFGALVLSRLSRPLLTLLVVFGIAILSFQKGYTDLRIELRDLAVREKDFMSDVEYLSKREGPAACEDILLCYESGKKMEVDFYIARERVMIKKAPESELESIIASKKFKTIQIDAFSNENIEVRPRFRFTESGIKSVLENYNQDRRTGWRAFFSPK